MHTGFFDPPDGVASQMVMASGQVREVFARPFVGGGAVHPFPTGFRLDNHPIAWSRHSDVVFQALRNPAANFAGLVCPRSRGEMGVRVACGSDILTIGRCLEEEMDARVKAKPDGERHVSLRPSDVPLALMTKLHLVVARVDGSLRLLASRVIRTSRFSMVVALDVVGPAIAGDLWRLEGLGMHPIVIMPVQRRGPVDPTVRVSPTKKRPPKGGKKRP